MNHPHIEIKTKGIRSKVYINDFAIPGVRKIAYEHTFGDSPVLNLEILATDISFDDYLIPELPDCYKSFYWKKPAKFIIEDEPDNPDVIRANELADKIETLMNEYREINKQIFTYPSSDK